MQEMKRQAMINSVNSAKVAAQQVQQAAMAFGRTDTDGAGELARALSQFAETQARALATLQDYIFAMEAAEKRPRTFKGGGPIGGG